MEDVYEDEEIWRIINLISIFCKKKIVKNISVKRKLIYEGNKVKWRDGSELFFVFNNVSFSVSYLTFYNDSDDFMYRNKSIIEKVEIKINNIKNIKKEDILSLLKFKLRVVKIEKFLKDE